MKLNENGDFCLLYVEPADEKQSLFATIGEQQKPVVLMLPLAGQPRSRLFQRPEDFSDLKHVRRQSGVSIVFLTAGSERLAQMAARYGFPSYPSIDDFADFLVHGRRPPREDDETRGYPPPLRQVRTGPLMPSAAVAQLAAMRQSSTRPLSAQAKNAVWTGPQSDELPAHPLPAREKSAVWAGAQSDELSDPVPARAESNPWTGHQSGIWPDQPLPMPAASDPWTGHRSDELPVEYTAAFHEAQTIPIGGSARFAWPTPGDDVSSVLPTTPPALPAPPVASGRGYGYRPTAPLARDMSMPVENEEIQPRFNEIPRRRSAQLPEEAHSRHPGWEAEERMFEAGLQRPPARPLASSVPAQGLRNSAARPTRDLREPVPTQAYGSMGTAPARPLPETPRVTSAKLRPEVSAARPLAGTTGTVAARPQPGVSGTGMARPSSATTGGAVQRTVPEARPAQVSSALPSVAGPTHKRGSFWPLLVILSLLIIVGGALGSFVAIARVMPATSPVAQSVGSIVFQSSEQLNENTSQGIDDQVQINLRGLSTPASGKSYYAWLLGDTGQQESQSILLGKLNVLNGTARLFYAGDALHTNLLQITSRFLVTEEDSTITPLLPSPNTSTWRYYGALPAVPDPSDAHHYSFLNHLRHLLADEPILDELELPGGLNNWFSRNTQELLQLTSSARDHWQNNHNLTSVRGQGVQILAYLDGMSYMEQDVPVASANVQVSLDTHLAALGLLNVRGTTQNPPSYMDQIVYHLNGLLNAPDSPGNVRTVAGQILPALSNITTWLQKLRSDDKSLLAMSNAQLGQSAALSLLDDMVLQAGNAYSGNTDPATNQFKQGVVWIHQQLQSIATINVSTYVVGQTPVPEIAPSAKPGPAFLLPLFHLWEELEKVL